MLLSKNKPSANEATFGSATIIGAGTIINGNIETNNDIRIDGALIGNISGKAKILIGPDGVVTGDIKGQQADVSGKITGKIRIDDLLQLHANANINGDIYAGKLHIEPTATFNGKCHMGANIVELNAEMNNAINQ